MPEPDEILGLRIECQRLRKALLDTALYKDGPYYYCAHCQAQGKLVCSLESVAHAPGCIVGNLLTSAPVTMEAPDA